VGRRGEDPHPGPRAPTTRNKPATPQDVAGFIGIADDFGALKRLFRPQTASARQEARACAG
jgi:hypothetical protein